MDLIKATQIDWLVLVMVEVTLVEEMPPVRTVIQTSTTWMYSGKMITYNLVSLREVNRMEQYQLTFINI